MDKKLFLSFAVVVALVTAYMFYMKPPQATLMPVSSVGLTAESATGDVVYYKDTAGYVAAPAGDGKYPAIILIHEWWGLNDDMKSMADHFATAGYVALAVDLYGGKVATTSEEAGKLVGAVRGNTDEAFTNLKSAVEYLKKRSDVDGDRLASVGWCFGGGWSYQMAVNDLGTEASIMYYGQFDPHDDFEHMRASILGHFGENDMSIKVDSVREFQAALATVNGAHEVYIYPNAGHGFANERGGTNAGYNKEATEIAWQRTMEFLSKALNK